MKISNSYSKSLIIFALGISACSPEATETELGDLSNRNLEELSIPADFSFETANNIQAQIQVKSLDDQNLPGIKVEVFDRNPDEGGQRISANFTEEDGTARFRLRVPKYQDKVFIKVHSMGFANSAEVGINGSNLRATFGGSPSAPVSKKSATSGFSKSLIARNYYYLGGFENGPDKGRPSYLEPARVPMSQSFLDKIVSTLPNARPVPINRPDLLEPTAELNLKLKQKSDVWVAFIGEDAANKNSLAYFVYDPQNPPSRVQDIDSIFVVFPNGSLENSGGQLAAGDQVKLGTFEAGQAIAWVLISNGWVGTGVNVNRHNLFSLSSLNNASDPTKLQQIVQLVDRDEEMLVLSFEDKNRGLIPSDDDFNDFTFAVSATPWSAVDLDNVPELTPVTDSDGDGINDNADAFPNDPNKALINTYQGSLAYEDLWPYQGDYDFNDIVVDYRCDHILNASNRVVEIEADWILRAVGASFANGFGFQIDNLPTARVRSVNGPLLTENIINKAANGTEAGQSKATVIVFDNCSAKVSPKGKFVNTVPGQPKVDPKNTHVKIILTRPAHENEIGLPPYNPFIFINGDRGREVHLADKSPTDLAQASLFGNGADNGQVNQSTNYKTDNGLPWAIDVIQQFNYPIEFSPINQPYLKFNNWASSGGQQYPDWFLDRPGHVDPSKIYR